MLPLQINLALGITFAVYTIISLVSYLKNHKS